MRPQNEREKLVEAWSALLSQWTWCWFCTFTFRDEVHPEAADKRFRVFISKLNRSLYGPRWFKKNKSVQWVRALEWQRRGVTHYHALIAGVGNARRLSWMDEWNRLAGFAKIEPIKSQVAVNRYCSKYITKGGEIDVGGFGTLEALRRRHGLPIPPASTSPEQDILIPASPSRDAMHR
jgi:hypothetical protein